MQDRSIYSRLDIDQLFYIFYYMTGTYEQCVIWRESIAPILTTRWCAAQELKKQSWRFHKQYLTWFQRAHNPQAITEDYEQGGYFYFDWENSWCQRKKSDFRFEVRNHRPLPVYTLTRSTDGSQNIDDAPDGDSGNVSGGTSNVHHMHPTTDGTRSVSAAAAHAAQRRLERKACSQRACRRRWRRRRRHR